MKINSISIFLNAKTETNKKALALNKSYIRNYSNIPCFYGKDLVRNQTSDIPAEIQEKIPKEYSIYELIRLAQTRDNKLGQGANSVVFAIPYLDDYVLKVLNKDDPNKIDIREFPSHINLGQPIWQDDKNPRILILKRIKGQEHSIENWSQIVGKPLSVTKEHSDKFLKQIQTISGMPQETFDRFAADVKILSDKGYKLDSINPNNLIVDELKQEIHIIDYFKVNPFETHLYQNSCLDLIAVICDFTLLPEYLDNMTTAEKEAALSAIKIIRDKTLKGCLKSGLSCDENKYITYINETSKWFPVSSVPNDNTGGEYIRTYNVRMVDFINTIKKL